MVGLYVRATIRPAFSYYIFTSPKGLFRLSSIFSKQCFRKSNTFSKWLFSCPALLL